MDDDSSFSPDSSRDEEGEGDVHTVEIGRDERPSEVVVRAASVVTNSQPLELNPLHDYVDPDALDAMFRVGKDGTVRSSGRFAFAFNGCEVTVQGTEVQVRPTIEPEG